jgi:hypothetical protein
MLLAGAPSSAQGVLTALLAIGVFGLPFGLAFGLPAGLAFGGYACLSQFALRLVLLRAGALPLRTVRFLDYATERVPCARWGEGYIFVPSAAAEALRGIGAAAGPSVPHVTVEDCFNDPRRRGSPQVKTAAANVA